MLMMNVENRKSSEKRFQGFELSPTFSHQRNFHKRAKLISFSSIEDCKDRFNFTEASIIDCDNEENICKNQLLPNERFYWSLVLILYFGIPITVVILSYIGLVSSVNEIRQSIIQMGRRSNRDGSGFQKTIICVTGGFILCWAPTIFLQVSQVTGLSGSIFRTKNFCNNFKEFAKERTLVLST